MRIVVAAMSSAALRVGQSLSQAASRVLLQQVDAAAEAVQQSIEHYKQDRSLLTLARSVSQHQQSIDSPSALHAHQLQHQHSWQDLSQQCTTSTATDAPPAELRDHEQTAVVNWF